MNDQYKIVALSNCRDYAKKVSAQTSIPIVETTQKTFSDGEFWIRFEETIRNSIVILFQTMYPNPSQSVLELLITMDALRRASAKEVIVVAPYLAYSRQDRKIKGRDPITAKVVANILEKVGLDRLVTFDLHSGQIQGFYDIPFDDLLCWPVLLMSFEKYNVDNLVVVAPDYGSVVRTKAVAKKAKCHFAIVLKERQKHNSASAISVIGDVRNKNCLIVDDMIDTGGTLKASVDMLRKKGARDIYVMATHGIFSGSAYENIKKMNVKKIFVTDSIDQNKTIQDSKIVVVDTSQYITRVIDCIISNHSISDVLSYLEGK